MSNIGLILLAAGGSTRMGRPKQLLVYEGQTLVRSAAETAIASGCSPVVVVVGHEADAVERNLADLDVQFILNDQWQAGMGSSIRRGLQAALQERPGMRAIVIMLCDQPFVTAEVIEKLIAAYQQTGAAVCASTYAESFGPPCLFAATQFGLLLTMPDDHGAKRLIATAQNVHWVSFEQGAIDLDTLADIEKLGERAGF